MVRSCIFPKTGLIRTNIQREPNQAWTTLFPSVSASGNMGLAVLTTMLFLLGPKTSWIMALQLRREHCSENVMQYSISAYFSFQISSSEKKKGHVYSSTVFQFHEWTDATLANDMPPVTSSGKLGSGCDL
jgi:hypothetical protein